MKIYNIGLAQYRMNPNGRYALYLHKSGEWRESASVTNEMLENQRD